MAERFTHVVPASFAGVMVSIMVLAAVAAGNRPAFAGEAGTKPSRDTEQINARLGNESHIEYSPAVEDRLRSLVALREEGRKREAFDGLLDLLRSAPGQGVMVLDMPQRMESPGRVGQPGRMEKPRRRLLAVTFTGIRERCIRLLLRSDPRLLRAYRRKADPPAEREFSRAGSRVSALYRVAWRSPLSNVAPRALGLAAELAFEEGRAALAARVFRLLARRHPLWFSRSPDALARAAWCAWVAGDQYLLEDDFLPLIAEMYPDVRVTTGEKTLRLLDYAALLLAKPHAAGPPGSAGPPAGALETLAARGDDAILWDVPLEPLGLRAEARLTLQPGGRGKRNGPLSGLVAKSGALPVGLASAGDEAYVLAPAGGVALELASGRLRYRLEDPSFTEPKDVSRRTYARRRGAAAETRGSRLVVAGRGIFGVLGRSGSRGGRPADRELLGFDKDREAALVFKAGAHPADEKHRKFLDSLVFFDGPVVVGDRLLVCARDSGRDGSVWLLCFDLSRGGRLLWRRWLCTNFFASNPGEGQALTAHGGVVFAVTNQGVVVAVDALSGDESVPGEILWITKYRVPDPSGASRRFRGPAMFARYWEAAAPRVLGGVLAFAPGDAPSLHLLDALSGRLMDVYPDASGTDNAPLTDGRVLLGTWGGAICVGSIGTGSENLRLSRISVAGGRMNIERANIPFRKTVITGEAMEYSSNLIVPTSRGLLEISDDVFARPKKAGDAASGTGAAFRLLPQPSLPLVPGSKSSAPASTPKTAKPAGKGTEKEKGKEEGKGNEKESAQPSITLGGRGGFTLPGALLLVRARIPASGGREEWVLIVANQARVIAYRLGAGDKTAPLKPAGRTPDSPAGSAGADKKNRTSPPAERSKE